MTLLLDPSKRYASGVVEAVYPNYIDVVLTQPLMGVTVVRVLREHWPAEKEQWKVADQIESLFVYDLKATQSRQHEGGRQGHGFASLRWGMPGQNPWNTAHLHHPVVGQVVSGVVRKWAGEHSVVVVFGQDQLEAFLHVHAVPNGKFESRDSLLPIGLEIRAKVIEVDSLRCKIEISVQDWLKDLARIQGPGPQEREGICQPTTPYVRYLNASEVRSITQHPAPPQAVQDLLVARWHGKGVLVIDDDAAFRNNLVNWLRQFGAQAWCTDNATHCAQLLEQHNKDITHVLVDYGLPGLGNLRDMLRLMLRNTRTRQVAIMSGVVDKDVKDMAKRIEEMPHRNKRPMPLFVKPLKFQVLDDWILKNETQDFDLAEAQAGMHWQLDHRVGQSDLPQRARTWLGALCRSLGGTAAVWVRCHQPGYACIASYGLLPKASDEQRLHQLALWTSSLGQTLVADTERTGKLQIRTLNDSGLDGILWPLGAKHVLALPRQTNGHGKGGCKVVLSGAEVTAVEDVLLLFSAPEVSSAQLEAPAVRALLQEWWADLLELGQLQDRLLEDAIFATQGRVHSATLHEMRPLLTVFQSPKPWGAEQALAWWDSGRKLSYFVEGGLYNIRPERIAQVNLRERLGTLVADYVWQFAARRFVSVLVRLPAPDLVATLAPEVFEQPLINLLDNATKACAHRSWARVEVEIEIQQHDARLPLVVRVRDQGHGLTPDQKRTLFLPRHTHDGGRGFGMGLFVSQRLARAAGGELVCTENHRWGGCTFELRLPLACG